MAKTTTKHAVRLSAICPATDERAMCLVHVAVSVDAEEIAKQIARRVFNSKRGTATECHGAIVAKLERLEWDLREGGTDATQ